MKTIVAFGQKAQDLGGYRDHNPFRLFARERFRRFVRAEVGDIETDVNLLISGDLGAGQWFAEVAAEEAVPYHLVTCPGADEKWSAHQRAKMADLASKASGIAESTVPEAFLSSALLAAQAGERVAFVAMERDKAAGRLASEVRRIRESGVGARIVFVYPDEMTPPYLVLGALEEVRAAVPSSLLKTVEGAKLQLDILIGGGATLMRPTSRERARVRREELAALETALRAILHREGK